jgi:hypothetical protein
LDDEVAEVTGRRSTLVLVGPLDGEDGSLVVVHLLGSSQVVSTTIIILRVEETIGIIAIGSSFVETIVGATRIVKIDISIDGEGGEGEGEREKEEKGEETREETGSNHGGRWCVGCGVECNGKVEWEIGIAITNQMGTRMGMVRWLVEVNVSGGVDVEVEVEHEISMDQKRDREWEEKRSRRRE